MEARKVILGIAILAFVLIETTFGKSQRRHNRKTEIENGDSQDEKVVQVLSSNLTSTEAGAVKTDSPIVVPASSPGSNDTLKTDVTRKAKKSHRLKHRRQHHKRKHHYKRLRKNRRRKEKEDNQGHELQTVGVVEKATPGTSRDPKQMPHARTHHHKKSNKHHQRQQRRLRRKKQFQTEPAGEHKDEADPGVLP